MTATEELRRFVVAQETERKTRLREAWILMALLAATFAAYLWGLDRNGWANPYYSAAAQAGALDWKAFFFGSLDWNNVITVDKPPLAIWPMALSVRIFGLSSWSILVPQALMGTATVRLLYAAVRRVFAAHIALAAAVLCATAPVFFLMTRFNNPEPLMGLLTVAGLYFFVRAIQNGRLRWYLLTGMSFGLAFLAKQFEGLMPVPALGLALLVFGTGALRRRLLQLGATVCSMIVAGGWWVAIVELVPAADRPYVGGSTTNSIIELTFGYNGLARIVPASAAGSDPSAGGELAPYDGGFGRLFNGNFAPENGWLLATAITAVALLAVYGRALGGRSERALAFGAGAWFLSDWLLLSFMGNVDHTYYVYALVTPMALVIALALRAVWLRAGTFIGRLFGVFLLSATAYIGVRVMQYSDAWSWWGPMILTLLAAGAGTCWLLSGRLPAAAVWTLTITSLAAGQIGTDVFTATNVSQGTQPLSGPISNDPHAISRHMLELRTTGRPAWAVHIADGVAPSPALLSILSHEQSSTGRWLVATYPAQDAARLQLTTGRPVLAVGGWIGTDPTPTLDQFKDWVRDGEIEYFVDDQAVRAFGVGRATETIAEWVESTYRGEKVNDAVVYRLDAAHEK